MDGMTFCHNEEFYTASFILSLLAMKHYERVVQGCSIPIYDSAEAERIKTGYLERILGGVDRFDVYGPPSRTTYEVKFHHFFIGRAPHCFASPSPVLVLTMQRGLQAGDIRFSQAVQEWTFDGYRQRDADDPWVEPFAEALASFLPAETHDDDEVPF